MIVPLSLARSLFNYDKENDFYEDVNSGNGGGGLDPNNTAESSELDINDQVLEEAELKGPSFRLHDEHHIYLDENNRLYDTHGRFIPQGIDGIPNQLNCIDVPFGEFFPDSSTVKDGDYYLRVDMNPPRLFKRFTNEQSKEGGWRMVEYDNREKWTGVPMVLRSVINNDTTVKFEDGEVQPARQNIKDLVKARVKKEHGKPRPWKDITIIEPDATPTGI